MTEQDAHEISELNKARNAYYKQETDIPTLTQLTPRYTRKKTSKYIIWPFLVILPLFLISMIINLFTDSNETSNIQTDPTTEELLFIFKKLENRLPDAIKNKILEDPYIFSIDLSNVFRNTPLELLLLVDKSHKLSIDFIPSDIVQLKNYKNKLYLNKDSMQLREILIPDLIAMTTAAKEAGIILYISSAYRSYTYQKEVFERITNQVGLKEAEQQSAKPGASQHQLGTAIDFGSIDESFANTDAGKWLASHAWKYGFSLSYPQNFESITGYIYESWHFRYIGKAASLLEQTYFNGIQQYMLEFISAIDKTSILYKF